ASRTASLPDALPTCPAHTATAHAWWRRSVRAAGASPERPSGRRSAASVAALSTPACLDGAQRAGRPVALARRRRSRSARVLAKVRLPGPAVLARPALGRRVRLRGRPPARSEAQRRSAQRQVGWEASARVLPPVPPRPAGLVALARAQRSQRPPPAAPALVPPA